MKTEKRGGKAKNMHFFLVIIVFGLLFQLNDTPLLRSTLLLHFPFSLGFFCLTFLKKKGLAEAIFGDTTSKHRQILRMNEERVKERGQSKQKREKRRRIVIA